MSDVICPAPPRYVKGLAVIAFLAREKGKWETVALSYGTRYPASNAELEAYRLAVTLAKDVEDRFGNEEATSRSVEMESARVDWQVRVAAHPATRWDGLYGLVPEADDARSFYGGRHMKAVRLSRAQREALARGFVEAPPLDRSLPMMLMALRGHADEEVDQSAARALETVLSQGKPRDWVSLAFNLLRERHGEKPPPRKAPTPEDQMARIFRDAASGPSGPGIEDEDSLSRAWTRFKKRHRLKPALLPLPVEPPVPGTGGDTPL
ncbi:hypothetical protein NVS55_31620 [Myxococcus stipitatus]|uniref:hypothetical protein n=1 Tax=Myxococcus stipitatus TaxID=83455 RepID=UPI003145080E